MSDLRFLFSVFFFLLLMLGFLGGPIAEAAGQPKAVLARFSLRDYLNRNWHNELVTFKVDARLVGRRDVALLDAGRAPARFQWHTCSTAGIAFLASVPSFARIEYSLVERRGKRVEDRGRRSEIRGQRLEDGGI